MIDLSQYKVVILCGGQGTRIRGVADNLPKPLIDIGGRPILWHIMKIYSFYGLKKFVLCLGYKGDAIIDYFENYHARTHDFTMKIKDRDRKLFTGKETDDRDVDDWELTFALTGENTMTGGRVKRIRNYIDEDVFFCTYGDGVSDVDINALFGYHWEKGKAATLTGVHLPTTFGIVEAGGDGIVSSFREKPVMSGLINGGFFVFDRSVFDHIEGDDTVLEETPFKRLVRTGDIAMYRHGGFWHCMDTYKDYVNLNRLWAENKAPWKIW
ncbi:MAG: glucose-1-phosphate cytidylyltransferase [Chitinivibrionales bacterium]|nr:glucose-1-phosphate cytidylyltransferase [Chitinivibrionales bacterium]MBD3396825.1 glucose-1-phosphate cytidylyltransferase [Chitinivibrionales bacterium]